MSSRRAAGATVALGALSTIAAGALAQLGYPSPQAWLPAGAGAAILLCFGHAYWPAFAIGAALGSLGAGHGLLTAIGAGLTATAGPALLALYLVRSRFESSFGRRQDVLRFVCATALATALTATLAPLLPGAATLAGAQSGVAGEWLQWWLTTCLGTLLMVPMLVGASSQSLASLAQHRVELALVLLAALLVMLVSIGAPTPRNGLIVGPLSLIIVGYATLRLHFSVAFALAGLLTCVIGISAEAAPVSEFVSGLFGLARAWAFGLVHALLIFTIQLLRSERLAALETLRTAERQHRDALLRAARLEQLRIGQQMHDELGQEATALSLLARSLARRLEQGRAIQPSEAQMIVESAQRIHAATRNAVQRLLAVDSHDGSLKDALESLVDRLQRAGAPVMDLQLPPALPAVHPQVAEVLFRTAQEALNNAVKHAQATRISIGVTCSGEHLELRVADNGVGFDAGAATGGFGLRNMRSRAEEVGGRLRSETGANTGTEIRLELPFSPSRAA